jgi:pyridoxal phosphate enzyme (YggS family)
VIRPLGEEPGDGSRRAELADGLAAVERRVAAACNASGRARSDVTVVVVTKTFPASDVRLLSGLGVHEVGESRDQEAAAKALDCADLDLAWHFVGRLQSNKARSVASYASVVHSVDRVPLVRALGSGGLRAGRTVGVLLQISLDGDPTRGGLPADRMEGIGELAAAVAGEGGLELRGLMAVAPMDADPLAAFARLAEVADAVRRDHPAATWISAGMSGDLEAAVSSGATHLRVGSAILGSRPSLR